MALEFAIERPKDAIRRATLQFAARRGLRVSEPWYLDGLRLEMGDGSERPGEAEDVDMLSGMLNAATSFLLEKPRNRAYVDIELSRKRGQTIVLVKFGEHPQSAVIASALQAFLHDDAVFSARIPVVCSNCTTPVVNIRANYCGRCGMAFSGSAAGRLRDSASHTLPPLPSAAREPSPVAPARADPPAEAIAGVSIEREVTAAGDEAIDAAQEASANAPASREAQSVRVDSPPAKPEASSRKQAEESESADDQAPADEESDAPAPARRSRRRSGPMIVED